MFKFLILLAFLVGFSFFVTDVFSVDIEIMKEEERIIESMGWITPELHTLQEQLQIIIDEANQKNRITVGMLSTNPNDMRFPEYLEKLAHNPKIFSFTLTNQFACAPTAIERACIVVDVKREGLGDNMDEIRKNTREITDEVIGESILHFQPEFSSITLQGKTSFDGGEEVLVSQAIYTINKQPTDNLFSALSTLLLSSDIRTAGGFYDIAENLSEHHFSEFTVTVIPLEDSLLRSMKIALTCSNIIAELPSCDREEKTDDQITRGYISPLDLLEIENISRSKIFEGKFLPLNSLVQVLIFSEKDLQVKSVSSSVIERLSHISDIQDNGWFFASKSGKKIDARYLFGQESSVNKNNLAFLIGPNTGEDIEIVNNVDGGGCLIATAAFGSELAPQVQFLREIRDNTILQTESGTTFMTGFNQFYYSFSPAIADYERENPAFKEAVKLTLTPLLTSLTLLQYANIDSESEMLGYGIGIILLNIGMYFVAPAILIMKVKNRI